MSQLGSRALRLRLAHWPKPRVGSRAGYALLVPVPGDLPVFTHLALVSLRRQATRHRLETIVVPDRADPRVADLVRRAVTDWPGALRMELIRNPERKVLPKLGDPGRNHGYQIFTGVVATAATHVVLHDADLFLLDEGAHDRGYERAVARGLDVLGISPAWDSWYAERGRTLAATWEMTARADWLRATPPWRLLGHEDVVLGERHVLDTTFWAQMHTDPARIAVQPIAGVVHFNYLISAYRTYGRRAGTFSDQHCALLVIRVLTDLFDVGDSAELPTMAALTAALAGDTGDVTYADCTSEEYANVRAQLDAVLTGAWASAAQRASATAALAPFDERFGWVAETTGRPEADADLVPPADVAVVVPVHDRAPMLPGTLAAILAQVPAPAEVIVVDDASTDGSAAVAESTGVRVIRRTVNAGNPGPPRNEGMHAATATWVAFCDSDDVWAQGHLAELLAHTGPGVDLVSAPTRTTDGGWLGNARGRRVRLDAAGLLAPGVNMVMSATMVRRQAALAAGGFRSFPSEDLDLWLRMARNGAAVLTAMPSVLYRRHPGQISHRVGVVSEAEAIVAEHLRGSRHGRRLGVRWASQLRWDELRNAVRDRDRQGALTSTLSLVRSPTAIGGVASLLVYRRRVHGAMRKHPQPLGSAERYGHQGGPDHVLSLDLPPRG